MRTTFIPCPNCEGKGKAPLSKHLQETLALIPKRGSVVAEDVQKKLSLETPNAASNRLLDLLILGLVKRERSGKFWNYSRT